MIITSASIAHSARLAREGREPVKRLEAISHELMAKVLELDTVRDKDEQAAAMSGE